MVKYTPIVGLGSLGQGRANVIFDEMPGRSIDRSAMHKLAKLKLPSGRVPYVNLNKELIRAWDLCKDCMGLMIHCLCTQNIHKRKLSTKKADTNKLAALHAMLDK